MTLTEIQKILRGAICEAAKAEFGIEIQNLATEVPPKPELGDVAFPVAFELAKLIKQQAGEKQNPRAIAEILKSKIETLDFVDGVEIAGPGYLNVFYARAAFLGGNASAQPLPAARTGVKVCVEHTSVNPNKAAHIGHVRNSVLGDTFARILSATGKKVEVQNYIDNTGVQVADVVVGFIYLRGMDLSAIKALDASLAARAQFAEHPYTFDYYCWDLYTEVVQQYASDEDLKAKRAEVLHLIEEGGNFTGELADYIATRNVECITETMERLGIRYDLLPRESEILHLHFWDKAFETMKKLGVIHFIDEGKQKGCWVMPFEEHEGTDEHEGDKILVRSNSTVTYTGKDIAYQMWKLGILGLDFNYRKFYEYSDGRQVWMTTSQGGQDSGVPRFGGGETIYNVIDTRQSYPQEVVKKGVAAISPERGEKASVHLAYEMVALSPAAAEELGFQLRDEDRSRPFIEMSGRKGLGVKADDLLDRLEANALVEVESRHPGAPVEEKQEIAHQIAVGALRYFLLKFTRNTIIVFDFKEALSFDGETGAFCQYSAVRANSIFRKLAESNSVNASERRLLASEPAALNEMLNGDVGTDIWSLIMLASKLEETVNSAANASEPAILAKYTFNLAKAFNAFYRDHKIISEPDDLRRAVLIIVADIARRSLTAALATLGIEVPERM